MNLHDIAPPLPNSGVALMTSAEFYDRDANDSDLGQLITTWPENDRMLGIWRDNDGHDWIIRVAEDDWRIDTDYPRTDLPTDWWLYASAIVDER